MWFCLFVLSLAPPPPQAVSLTVWGWHFTSVYLDSPAVVVWIWIMNPFSHSHQDMPGASCYGYSTSWLRETLCEINLTRETYFFCLTVSLSPLLFSVAPGLFTLHHLVNKPHVMLTGSRHKRKVEEDIFCCQIKLFSISWMFSSFIYSIKFVSHRQSKVTKPSPEHSKSNPP